MTLQKAPTMKDVAKEAGVALGTVSKVINGIPVSEKNRLKVERAIRELNYEVNTYARGLKTRKSNLVALILPNTTNPFFAAFADHVEAFLYQKGLRLLLCCADGIPQKEIDYLNMAANNKVDGIISMTYSDIGKYIPPSLPMVVFDRFFENRVIPRVASDNFSGGCLAVEKLLEFGCKQFGLTPDYLDEVDCGDRLQMMRDFLNRHKNPDGSLTFDGVFSHTDYHGYQFYRLLLSEGYRVPQDVQIIGFDGIRQFGNKEDHLFISSICQPIELLAQKCVEILTTMDKVTPPSLTLLPASYQYGGTTKDPDYPNG